MVVNTTRRCTARRLSPLLLVLLTAIAAGQALGGPTRVREGAAASRPPPLPEPGRMHILAIGIEHYAYHEQGQARGVPLEYSIEDGRKLTAAFEDGARGIFTGVRVRHLREEEATLAGIDQAFDHLARTALPQDALVVMFMGMALVDANGAEEELLLMAQDFGEADHRRFEGGERPGHVVSATMLSAWLSRVQARRQVLLIDASGSTASLGHLLRKITERDVRLGNAGARARVVVGTEGFSVESKKIGGGTVTTALLHALAGEADVGPDPDGIITCHELEVSLPRTYLELLRAHEVSEDYGRLRTLAVGPDFALAAVEPDDVPARAPPERGRLQREADPQRQQDAPATARRDLALIFATSVYDHAGTWRRLSNPGEDAKALETELETRYGFEVDRVDDPTFATMRDHIAKYQRLDYGPHDQLLVFVAGHGEYDDVLREGYIVARDSGPGPTPFPGISNSDFRTAIDAIPCRHILVVLDTCFGGTFDERIAAEGHRGGTYDGIPIDDLVRRLLGYRTRLYLTSGGKEYVSDGRPGQHSPFAYKFLEALRGRAGRPELVTWTDLVLHVRDLQTAPRAGTFGSCDPGADFLFLRR